MYKCLLKEDTEEHIEQIIYGHQFNNVTDELPFEFHSSSECYSNMYEHHFKNVAIQTNNY